METLTNANDITLNFNLRAPKGKRVTNLYAVIKMDGKQIKTPIDCKINPWQWDSKKQNPLFTRNMTEEDRENAQKVFNVIYQVKENFQNYFIYLCTHSVKPTKEELTEKVFNRVRTNKNKEMKEKLGTPKKRVVKATTTLQKALELYPQLNSNVGKSSLATYKTQLTPFNLYCEEIKKDSIKMLSDEGLREFEIYLRKNGKTENAIKNSLRTIKSLINEVITKHSHFEKMGIKKVSIELPKVKKNEGKKVGLTDEEIQKLKECNELTDLQKEYRDLFLLACYTGQRASDLVKFFDKDTIIRDGYFVFFNKKRKQETLAKQTDEVMEIIERYKDGFNYVNFENRYEKNLTGAIKLVAKSAGLDREIEFTENGIVKKKPLYDMISSHFGRHTFITKLLASGMSADKIKYLTGHANTKMIEDVYGHLSAIDKIGILENMSGHDKETMLYQKGKEDKEKDLIKETKDVLVFLGADYLEVEGINNLDELLPMLYIDYELKIRDLGISVDKLKALYNTKGVSLKEKRNELNKWIEEFKNRTK